MECYVGTQVGRVPIYNFDYLAKLGSKMWNQVETKSKVRRGLKK
jgi:hypothetical protein